jgi:hypothetical protein
MEREAEHCDVAIIGGGSAGIAAAIACSRQGSSVCIIERSERLGGAATNAEVGTVCGLSLCGSSLTGFPELDNPGLATEFAQQLAKLSNTTLTRNDAGLTYLPYTPRSFETASKTLLNGARDVRTHLHTTLVLAIHTNNSFHLTVQDQTGRTRLIQSRACIDCSGDAALTMSLGTSIIASERPQAAAQVFVLQNVPSGSEALLGLALRKSLREGALSGALPEESSYVSLVPGSLTEDSVRCKLALPSHIQDSHRDTWRGESLRLITRAVEYLRTHSAPFSSVTLGALAPTVGIRSGRRGAGLETLNENDIIHSKRSPTGVALGFWPMELWDSPNRPTIIWPERHAPYEIPLGALCSAHQPGLYFGGRCISASEHAIGSARVIGTCLSTGYAAGRAAVGFVRKEAQESVVSEIRLSQVDPFYRRNGSTIAGAQLTVLDDHESSRDTSTLI